MCGRSGCFCSDSQLTRIVGIVGLWLGIFLGWVHGQGAASGPSATSHGPDQTGLLKTAPLQSFQSVALAGIPGPLYRAGPYPHTNRGAFS